MQFFLHMKPPRTTHQTKAVRVVCGKPRFYEPQALKAARADLKRYLTPNRPPEPLTGPLRLVTKWCYPPGKRPAPTYKTTAPDTDNMIKLLKDVMTDLGFWLDDAQVASEITEKFWASPPGIFVQVEKIGDQP